MKFNLRDQIETQLKLNIFYHCLSTVIMVIVSAVIAIYDSNVIVTIIRTVNMVSIRLIYIDNGLFLIKGLHQRIHSIITWAIAPVYKLCYS